tara:strand:+ start:26019 stop:26468 length:450 start_codon:yes stop_codon:yes gene_type:complete
MLTERLAEKGYRYVPMPLEILTFHAAVKVGNLVFTSGQVPVLDECAMKGKVGETIDLETAQKAAEICAYNCLRAAGAVVDINTIMRVVKITGFVNAADSFNQMFDVINGATLFFTDVFGAKGFHSRSAIGARLPFDFAVEVEAVFELCL